MTRQSISLPPPNNDWLNAQITSEEFASKSEVINDLIRKARSQQTEIELVREKLMTAEKSGFVDQPAGAMLINFKEKARHSGDL